MAKQKLEFNWSYKNYELRACPKRLVRFKDDEPNETINLVKWDTNSDGKKYCYSLAYWIKGSEGYELKFVGGRPFEDIESEDIEVVWQSMEIAQKVLDGWFKLEYMVED